jgi:4-amino-4-deoxychorismate lyase
MTFIPIQDEGFRYGYGIFETLLIQNSKPLFLEWHLDSFQNAAKALSLNNLDTSIFLNEPPQGDGIWRWLGTPTDTYHFFEPGIPSVPKTFSIAQSSLRRSSQAWESRYKTLSYLISIQAKKESPGDEAILLNEHGEIACAAMANVFWVKNSILYTPSPECGCRSGVIRRWVCSEFKEIKQGKWIWDDLLESDEIFLTNSRIGICPVSKIAEILKPIGPITIDLQKRYSACVAQQLS